MSGRWQHVVAVLISFVTLCSACVGGSTQEQAQADLIGPPLWSSFSSPLEAQLGIEGPDIALELARMRQVQEATQACMALEGFDFPVEAVTANEDIGPGIELSEDDYILQYGFGVYTAFVEVGARDPDPVVAVIDALPVGERRAYALALYGPISDVRLGDSPNVEAGHEGCALQAQYSVPPVQRVSSATEDLLLDFEAWFQADPEVVAVWSVWSECMVAAGYAAVDRPGNYADQLFDDLGVLLNSAPLDEVLTVAKERAPGERELARASFQCEVESRPVLLDLRRQREQAYLETL